MAYVYNMSTHVYCMLMINMLEKYNTEYSKNGAHREYMGSNY